MDNVTEPSRLFRDLLDLEEDFKYNLTLLKVRDTEIERCHMTNKKLQEMLKFKLAEIGGLSFQLSNLEKALAKSEQERESGKQASQQIVCKLTENLKEVTRKFEEKLKGNVEEFERKQLELEKCYSDLLQQKEEDHELNLRALDERLQKQIISTSKTMNRLQKLIDENMSLRNKIRQLESQYTSETYFYKNEFKTLQSTNSNLNSEIECLKDNYASLQVKFGEIKLENDNLSKELRVNAEKISNLIKQNKEIVEENNKIRQKTQEYENLNKELNVNNELLTHQKNQLEVECRNLERIMGENKSYCNVPEHNNYDFIVGQNTVLQNLVKSMRSERKAFIEQNEEAENRLEKLELLMNFLKERAKQSYLKDINQE